MDIARQIRAGAPIGWMCAVAALMAGCAGPDAIVLEEPARITGPRIDAGNQGHAWEALFTPAQAMAGAEATRRDAELNIRGPEPVTHLGMWPSHPRPHLGQMRRIFLPRRADDVLYFREGPPAFYHRTWWVWH